MANYSLRPRKSIRRHRRSHDAVFFCILNDLFLEGRRIGYQRGNRAAADIRDHLAPRRGKDHADGKIPALRGSRAARRLRHRQEKPASIDLRLDGAERKRGSRSARRSCSSTTTVTESTSSTHPATRTFPRITYRVLTAVDAVVMVIDAAKGSRHRRGNSSRCAGGGGSRYSRYEQAGPADARPARAPR